MKKALGYAFLAWLFFLLLLLVAPQRREEKKPEVRPLDVDEVEALIEEELDQRMYDRQLQWELEAIARGR